MPTHAVCLLHVSPFVVVVPRISSLTEAVRFVLGTGMTFLKSVKGSLKIRLVPVRYYQIFLSSHEFYCLQIQNSPTDDAISLVLYSNSVGDSGFFRCTFDSPF